MYSRSIGTIIDVLGHLNIVSITTTFSKTIPIYGLVGVNTGRSSDTSMYFNTDSGHTLRLYMWYMYWGYVDGSSSYDYISRWHSMGNNRYITFFDDTRSNPYVDVYVNFNRISGNNYKTGYAFALVDSRDIS